MQNFKMNPVIACIMLATAATCTLTVTAATETAAEKMAAKTDRINFHMSLFNDTSCNKTLVSNGQDGTNPGECLSMGTIATGPLGSNKFETLYMLTPENCDKGYEIKVCTDSNCTKCETMPKIYKDDSCVTTKSLKFHKVLPKNVQGLTVDCTAYGTNTWGGSSNSTIAQGTAGKFLPVSNSTTTTTTTKAKAKVTTTSTPSSTGAKLARKDDSSATTSAMSASLVVASTLFAFLF